MDSSLGARWDPLPRWSRERYEAARALLFCLPYPGFGAGFYRHWPQSIDGVVFCPIDLPGRAGRAGKHAAGHLGVLADALVEALAPYIDCPFAFFGHGEAALLGYEATLRMNATGRATPHRLYVSAQPAPHHGPHDRLARMTSRQLTDQACRWLDRLGEDSASTVDSCLRRVADEIALLSRYRPIEPADLPCPVVAVGWRGDTQVDYRLMRGWTECAPTTFVVLDGDHQEIAKPPKALLDLLACGMVRERVGGSG